MRADPQDYLDADFEPVSEHGAVSTEYAVIAGLISVGIMVGAGMIGSGLASFFTMISQVVDNFSL